MKNLKKRLLSSILSATLVLESVFQLGFLPVSAEEPEEEPVIEEEEPTGEGDGSEETNPDQAADKVVYFDSGIDFNMKIDALLSKTSGHEVCRDQNLFFEKFQKEDVEEIRYYVDASFTDHEFRMMDGAIYGGDVIRSMAQSNPDGDLVKALNATGPDYVYAFLAWEYADTQGKLKVYEEDYHAATPPKAYPYESKSPTLVMFTDAAELCLGDNMSYAFLGFSSLKKLDRTKYDILTRLQTGSAFNMSGIFSGCESLSSVNLESIATPSVTDMSYMFSNCKNLTTVKGTTAFDTSKVQNMSYMFQNCEKFNPNDLIKQFNTSKVQTFEGMFAGCGIKGDVTLSNFNSSSAKNTSKMFWGCGITSFVFPDTFDCALVTDMSEMFYLCSSLDHIDFGNVNAGKVNNTTNMLRGCTKLEWIHTFQNYPLVAVEMPENDYYLDEETLVRSIGIGSDPEVLEPLCYIARHLVCVEFMPNGGKGEMAKQFGVPKINLRLHPASFTYEGYLFAGWSLEPTAPADYNKAKYTDQEVITLPDSAKLTLYAVWSSTKVEITYDFQWDNDGDQLKDTLIKEMNYGVAFGSNLPPSKRKGYTVSWNTASDGSGEWIDENTICKFVGTVTLYAIYEPIHYDVTFIANGGEGEPVTQKMTYDKKENLSLNTFTKGSSFFVGWSTSATDKKRKYFDGETVVNLANQEGKVFKLYAVWSDEPEKYYTITYDLAGGYLEDTNVPSYTSDDKDITLHNPMKEDSRFVGWTGTDLDDFTMEVVIPKGSKGDRSYTAHYNTDKFTVTFLYEDEEYAVQTVSFNGLLTKPANPEKEGYSFAGWYNGEDRWDFETPIRSDMTLKAKMSKINTRSGMINDLPVSEDGKTLYSVKGQSITLGNGQSGWISSDPKTVKVNKKNGKMTAKKAGMAVLTNTNTMQMFTVAVYDPTLSAKSLTVHLGKEELIGFTDLPDVFNVSWQSSNPDIAQCVGGQVIGVGAGKCKVYAYVNSKKFTVSVTVVDKCSTPVQYEEETNIKINIKQSVTPKYSGFDIASAKKTLDGKTESVRSGYKTTGIKNGIVQVNNTGAIIGLNAGTAVVTYKSGKDTRKVYVTVVAMASRLEMNVPVTKSKTVKISGFKNNEFSWASEDTTIASVDAKGKVLGLSAGSTVITATRNTNIYRINVNVVSPSLATDSFLYAGSMSKKAITYNLRLPENSSYSIRQCADGTEGQLLWKSSNTKLAPIDEFGTVYTGSLKGKAAKKITLSTKIEGITVKVNLLIDPTAKMPEEGYTTDYSYKTIALPGKKLLVHLTMSGKYYLESL